MTSRGRRWRGHCLRTGACTGHKNILRGLPCINAYGLRHSFNNSRRCAGWLSSDRPLPIQERRRDQDNLCTGVLKAALDGLVCGRWIEDDSHDYVQLEPPVVCVEPGVRSLVLEFETSDVVTDRQLPSVAESSVPAAQVGSTSQPRGRR